MFIRPAGMNQGDAALVHAPMTNPVTAKITARPRAGSDSLVVGKPIYLCNVDNTNVRLWTWELSGPNHSKVSAKTFGAELEFTPDVPGAYTAQLVVHNGYSEVAQAVTELHIVDAVLETAAARSVIGERFEPGTPEAEAHPERVRPPNTNFLWAQIRDYARALGYQAHVEGTPPTADADELRIVLRRAAYYADKSGLSIIDREKFEADLTALNQYLVDVHACTNPDGSPKVDAAAQLGRVPDESGPAAARRLLKIARFRGAFLSTSPISKLYEMIEARDRTIEALTKECGALKVELGKARADRELAQALPDHSDFEKQFGCTWAEWQARQARALRDIEVLIEEMVHDKSLNLGSYPAKGESSYEMATRLLRRARDSGAFSQAADRMNGATSERTMATVAAFVQRHTGMGTAELARIPGIDLLDLADTVLKQDRLQAHETARSRAELELQQIRDLLNAYGHLKAESTLEQNLRRVITDLQHWRSFTHRQGRRTGAEIPKDGELTAEQAVEHFDLVVSFGKKIADDLQQVSDLVLDRQSRMSANASKAVGLLDVLRGLIADAHVPSVDARDMAELRARAEKAEAEIVRCEARLEAATKRILDDDTTTQRSQTQQVTFAGEKFALPLRLALDFLDAGDGEPRVLVLLRALAERVVYTDTSGGAVNVIAELQTSLGDVRRTNKQLQDLILKERAACDSQRQRADAAEAKLTELAADDKYDHILRG